MPSRLYVLLGKQVAFFRRKAGLTQEELAERTGYSVDFIGLVERGINAPTVARLAQVADVLGVEVWQLFKGPEGEQVSVGGGKPSKRRKARAGKRD